MARASVKDLLAQLPSVDKLIQTAPYQNAIDQYGREEVLRAIRHALQAKREAIQAQTLLDLPAPEQLYEEVASELSRRAAPKLKQVINLTGTVLHTNLGRAVMPPVVVEAIAAAAAQPCALEYDLGEGKRGDRDEIVEELLCEITGAEAATIVNNNAAAVFLLLHALGLRKEVIVSRGELVEIGGSFRIPDIMMRAGAKLKEVGTTNRTHAKDFVEAIGPKTSMIMKIHTSNYAIAGFTHSVPEAELAEIAHQHQLPFVVDLGSGTLVDMAQFNLPAEPTPQEALQAGADLVTFSGDKLLGGPQAGILVGRKDLIQKIKKNPLKRVLRVGKITLAGLEAVLQLYRDPARLPQRLTVLQLLTRTQAAIQLQTEQVLPQIQKIFAGLPLQISTRAVLSQIGSGSLPIERLPSVAIAIEGQDKTGEKLVTRMERLLRAGQVPVIGRFQEKALLFDLRCLQDEHQATWLAMLEAVASRLKKAKS